jgi:hypothetical protein
MNNIIEPNESFDFSKLALTHPIGIQGGAYFTKIEYNKGPLYIQTAKSQTRQGFVKTGKKYYCDIMFDKNAEVIINWFENLEEKCKKLIFDKRDAWFQNNLEEADIESAFNPIIRIYKSGKYYLVRTNIKNNQNDLPAIKIYNEQEIPLTINDVNSETHIISILEIQGIKFTSRNFQIEIELKQAMVLNDEPIFDSCLIKTNVIKNEISLINVPLETKIDDLKLEPLKDLNPNSNVISLEGSLETNVEEMENMSNDNGNGNGNDNDNDNGNHINDILSTINLEEKHDDLEETGNSLEEKDNLSIDLEIEDLNEDVEKNDDLKEMDNLDLSLENLETIQLKKPNQIYFELYKEARNKAKLAKKNALLAYLEAKNIKKTYMIDNFNDSDSDIDAEIDDVSESELEGL